MSTQDRQVVGYLKPKNKKLFDAYASDKNMTKSELVDTMADNFFGKLPEAERLRLLEIAKNNQSKNLY
jgi:hypothetical protein